MDRTDYILFVVFVLGSANLFQGWQIKNSREMIIKHEVCVQHKSMTERVYLPCESLKVNPNET